MNYRVFFPSLGRLVLAEEGMTLQEIARMHGIRLNAPCNGEHKCGKCRVKVIHRTGAAQRLDAQPAD